MKLTTEIMAVCDLVQITNEGKLNIINIFDNVKIKEYPSGLSRFFLVAIIIGKVYEKYKLKLIIKDKYNNILRKFEEIDIMMGKRGKFNLILEIVNLEFPKSGIYDFYLYKDEEEINFIELNILKKVEDKKIVN